MAEMKPWLCREGKHRLGMIAWNGNGIPQLLLYRHAVNLDDEHPADVDVIGPLQGWMPVRCDICEDVRLWDVSVDVLAEFILGLRRKEKDQLEARLLRGRVRRVTKHKNRAKLEGISQRRKNDS